MYKAKTLKENLRFVVLGMGDEAGVTFTDEIRTLIQERHVFSGSKRHRELVAELLPEGATWIDVTVPLSDVYDQYAEYDEEIMVFASGDPLFFGYTTTLMREFPKRVRKTYPYFNSLQLLAHSLTLPYHDMRVCSLTGRPWHEFDKALIERTKKLGVLTDRKKTPRVIAQRMLQYGFTGYTMNIGVLLGGEREAIHRLELSEVAERDFPAPNCIILEAKAGEVDYAAPLGLDEADFHWLNGRAKMITKMPIRLLSLSILGLHKVQNFWDVGFCTGSVSVEARLQFPHLNIRSFEIREEGDELMRLNSERFSAPNINYHIGDFMEEDISEFEVPEAVFIGGHGGKLIDFLIKLNSKMQDKGCIVFNSVSEKSLNLFREAVRTIDWQISQEMRVALDEHNPITILKAEPKG